MPFGDNLKKLRHEKRLTQKQVAEAVGISQGNYSALESGKFDPSLSTLCGLADFFEQSLDELTDFIRIVSEEDALTAEEQMWVNLYRELNPVERSLLIGVVSVVRKQREHPVGYLPTDMNVVDWQEEQKQRERYNEEENEDEE